MTTRNRINLIDKGTHYETEPCAEGVTSEAAPVARTTAHGSDQSLEVYGPVRDPRYKAEQERKNRASSAALQALKTAPIEVWKEAREREDEVARRAYFGETLPTDEELNQSLEDLVIFGKSETRIGEKRVEMGIECGGTSVDLPEDFFQGALAVGGARCSCGEPIGIVQGAWTCPRCASTYEVGMSFVMEQETVTTKRANEMVGDWLATVAPDWLPDSDWKAIVMDYEQSLAISCAFGFKNYCVKKAIGKDLRRAVNAAMTELSQWLRSEQ